VPFAVLFLLALATSMALWDDMASQLAPADPSGWMAIGVSATLCVVFLMLSRRKSPLLLCAAFLTSVRLSFVFAESMPLNSIVLAADCLGVCTALSVIVFGTEIANLWQRLRATFGKRVSPAECAAAVVASV
jgi:hypothetical protein